MRQIRFPVLRRLVVHGYEMYPGSRSNVGFEKEFQYGVNIAVGINGVGKTTLLNMIMRSLLGPWDPSKGDRDDPGAKQTGLTFKKKFSFFAERAPDGAANAVVTSTFELGSEEITVCRSLKNLKIKWYKLSGRTIQDPSEEEVFGHLCRMSGVSESIAYDEQRHYEFDFLVRNIIFFLENKAPLIWRPAGQFTALRILFLDEDTSQQLAKARNEVFAIDSAYRNFRWQAGSADKRLKEELRKEATPELVARRDLVVQQLKDEEEALEISLKELDEIERQLAASGPELILRRHEVVVASEKASDAEANHYHMAFHAVRSPADVLLESILADEQCLACGTSSPNVRSRAKRLLAEQRCPVCESHITTQEETEDLTERRLEELEKAEEDLAIRRVKLAEAEERHRQLTASYEELASSCSTLTENIRTKRAERLSIEGMFPDQEKMEELRKERDFFEVRIKGYKIELDKASRKHETLVAAASNRIEALKWELVEAFQHYANSFLIEQCQLVFDRRMARIAQEDREIEWPTFKVQMTSGEIGPPVMRDLDEQVSESQREFIELAFRMALIQVAANGGPSMLVVETPEASLDAPFVTRAGALLREFLSRNEHNALLASCNLNGERMIPALLGTDDSDNPSSMTREQRLKHILRLTDIARRPRAYTQFQEHYDRVFEDALKGAGYPE